MINLILLMDWFFDEFVFVDFIVLCMIVFGKIVIDIVNDLVFDMWMFL